MKSSITTLVESAAFDNKEFINDGGYESIADYLITNAENGDQGWLWYLSNEEIEVFQNDSEAADKMIEDIKDFLNTNYNYKLED